MEQKPKNIFKAIGCLSSFIAVSMLSLVFGICSIFVIAIIVNTRPVDSFTSLVLAAKYYPLAFVIGPILGIIVGSRIFTAKRIENIFNWLKR